MNTAPVLGCQTAHSVCVPPSLWRNNSSVTKVPRRCPGEPDVEAGGMEDSYETFEEELGPSRAEPPPQKPVRQIRRPEMQTTRKIREEVTPFPQQPRPEPRTLPKEPSSVKTTSLHKALSIQNLTQIETPWENVTLNRCLFLAITILVLASGFQKLHETFRAHGTIEEEEGAGLMIRRSGLLKNRGHPPQPEKSLWEVMFWWLPDLDDDEEDEDDEEVKRGKSKRASTGRRNRPLPDKKLLKQRHEKLSERRAKKTRDKEIKGKRGQVIKKAPEEDKRAAKINEMEEKKKNIKKG